MATLTWWPQQRVWAYALMVCFLTACPEQKTVAVYRVVPGAIPLPGVTRLAMGELEGPGGLEVGHLLAQALMAQKRYDILDWSTPFGGAKQGGWANQHGGWDSADATVVGAVLTHTVVPIYTLETTQAADGQFLTVYTRNQTLSVKALFRVIDPQTGRLLGTTTTCAQVAAPPDYATWPEAVEADDSFIKSLFDGDAEQALRQAAYSQLANTMAQELSYEFEPVMATLWHDAKREESVRALEGAAYGDWSKALEVYGNALLTAEFDSPDKLPQAHYNYGVALGLSGSFTDGIAHLETAYSLNQDKQTLVALEQIRAFAGRNH